MTALSCGESVIIFSRISSSTRRERKKKICSALKYHDSRGAQIRWKLPSALQTPFVETFIFMVRALTIIRRLSGLRPEVQHQDIRQQRIGLHAAADTRRSTGLNCESGE